MSTAILAKELGLPADDAACDAFQLAVLRWQPFSDSVEALKRLRTKFRLVAMTNADRVALSCYAHALGNPFDDTVCADETGVAKPNPEFFAYNKGRQSAFGYKQSDILHVAQSQHHDIGIARKLGYKVCWIERRQGMAGFGGTPEVPELTKPDFHFADAEGVRRRGGRTLSAAGAAAWQRIWTPLASATSLWASHGGAVACLSRAVGRGTGRCRHHRRGLHRAVRRASHRQERPCRRSCSKPIIPAGARAAAMAASSPRSFGSRSATSTPPMAAPWRSACTRSRMNSTGDGRGTGVRIRHRQRAADAHRPGQGRAQRGDAEGRDRRSRLDEARDGRCRGPDPRRPSGARRNRLAGFRRRRAQSRFRRHPSAELSARPRRWCCAPRRCRSSRKARCCDCGAKAMASSPRRRKARCARGRRSSPPTAIPT